MGHHRAVSTVVDLRSPFAGSRRKTRRRMALFAGAVLLLAMLCVSIAPPVSAFASDEDATALSSDASQFTDVNESEWYWTDGWVPYALDTGIMSGYRNDDGTTTTFGPYDAVTRGQVAVILHRYELGTDGNDIDNNVTTRFSDVPAGQYYSAAVSWASENGLVTGYDDGEWAGMFRPDAPVSREELAVMIARYAGFKTTGQAVAPAADDTVLTSLIGWNTADNWALPSLAWCTANGVIGGIDNGDGTYSLDPHGTAWRSAMAKIAASATRLIAGDPSRAEWAAIMLDAAGVSARDDIDCCPYTDLDKSPYADHVRTAWALGYIADSGSDRFIPEAPATREFAIASASLSAGYSDDGTELSCTDAAEADPRLASLIAVAIDVDLVAADGSGAVDPKGYVDAAFAASVAQAVRDAIAPEAPVEPAAEATYKSSVIALDAGEATIESATSVVVEQSVADGIAAGDVVAASSDAAGEGALVKVDSVEQTTDGVRVSGTAVDDVTEALDSFHITGQATVDASGFVPAPDVEVLPLDEADAAALSAAEDGVSALAEGEVDFGKFAHKFKFKLSDSADVTVAARIKPVMTYDVDWSLLGGLKKCYLVVDCEESFSVTLAATNELDPDDAFNKYLGAIPIKLPLGFYAKASIYANVSASGEVSFSAALDQSAGFSVEKGHFREIKGNDSAPRIELSGKAELKAGIEYNASLNYLVDDCSIVDVSVEPGLAGEVSVKLQSDGTTCVNFAAWFYFDVAAGRHANLMKALGWSWEKEIVDSSNSLFKKRAHFEGDANTGTCTYGYGTATIVVNDEPPLYKYRPDAVVRVYEKAPSGKRGELVRELVPTASGTFIARLYKGDYIVMASADGLIGVKEFSTGKGEKPYVHVYLDEGADPGSEVPEEPVGPGGIEVTGENGQTAAGLKYVVFDGSEGFVEGDSLVDESTKATIVYEGPGAYVYDYVGSSPDVTIPVRIDGANVVSVDLGSYSNLDIVQSVSAPACTKLVHFYFDAPRGDALSSIDLSDCSALETIKIFGSESNQSRRGQGSFKTLELPSKADSLSSIIVWSANLGALTLPSYPSLSSVTVYFSGLSSIDISKCTALRDVNVSNNGLASLNVRSNPKIVNLHCANNNMASLDVSGMASLEELDCSGNDNLGSLSVSGCYVLNSLYCNSSRITSLDVRSCTALKNLRITDSPVEDLDLRKNVRLHEIWVFNSHTLRSLKLPVTDTLRYVYCASGLLTSIDVSMCPGLSYFNCSGNNISNIDVSSNLSLIDINVNGNPLKTLDLSKNGQLMHASCDRCELESVAPPQEASNLETFSCSDNKLTTLDVSGLQSIRSLRCDSNELTTLDVSKLPNLREISCAYNKIADLSALEAWAAIDGHEATLTPQNV